MKQQKCFFLPLLLTAAALLNGCSKKESPSATPEEDVRVGTLAVNTARSTFYIDSEAIDNNGDGSPTNPLKSFPALMFPGEYSGQTSFLTSGDVVYIHGTFTNPALFIPPIGGITLRNWDQGDGLPLITFRDGQGIFIKNTQDIVIDGLRIQGPSVMYNIQANSNNNPFTNGWTFTSGAIAQPRGCAVINNPTRNPSAGDDARLNAVAEFFNGNGISIANSHSVVVRNCEIFECTAAGIGVSSSDNLLIEKNIVHKNAYWSQLSTSGISILNSKDFNLPSYYNSYYGNIIRSNRVYSNANKVGYAGRGECQIVDGNGIIIDLNSNADQDNPIQYPRYSLIENNICYNNGAKGIHIYASKYIDILNNTCYNNGRSNIPNPSGTFNTDGEISVNSATDINVYSNIMYAGTEVTAKTLNSGAITTTGYNLHFNSADRAASTDIVGANPLFVTAGSDFRLRRVSPAINSGSSVSRQFSIADFLGLARVGTRDIGAYEFSGTLTSSFTMEAEVTRLVNANIAQGQNSSGNSFVDYVPNAATSSITWYANVPTTLNNYKLTFRYANASGTTRNLNISVNGTPRGTVSFPATAAWNAWTNSTVLTIPLNSGTENRIVASTAAGAEGPNIDYISITP